MLHLKGGIRQAAVPAVLQMSLLERKDHKKLADSMCASIVLSFLLRRGFQQDTLPLSPDWWRVAVMNVYLDLPTASLELNQSGLWVLLHLSLRLLSAGCSVQ